MSRVDLPAIVDENAALYERARPTYPSSLLGDSGMLTNLGPSAGR